MSTVFMETSLCRNRGRFLVLAIRNLAVLMDYDYMIIERGEPLVVRDGNMHGWSFGLRAGHCISTPPPRRADATI